MGNYFSSSVSERRHGWKKDTEDKRDLHHNFKITRTHNTIKMVDLRDHMPEVYDQGQLGSCTANAIGGAYEYDQIKQGELEPFVPSRLFIYYNERAIEGTVDEDSGAMIRDGMKTINNIGVVPEPMWPYDIQKFKDKPTEDCFSEAQWHHSVEYKRVQQTKEQMKQCLIEGFPIIFGFVVYESFESPEVAQTGIMSMPKEGEKVLGGHAVVCCGFDESKQMFLIRNSWSSNWGIDGYFWMPYDFLTNPEYCSDLWTLKRVYDN